jgi:hypothetical protein
MMSIKIRTFRMHLAIIGYLALSFSTIFFGKHPWEECLTIDKIISVVSCVFVLQHTLMKTTDLAKELRYIHLFSVLLFIYISFFR